MIIETQRMILRPPKIEDTESLCDSLDDNVVKWLEFIPKFTYESAKDAISKLLSNMKKSEVMDYTFHLELKENGKMIGVIMVNNIDNLSKSCKLVYWLNPNYQRRGLISEALKEVIKFCHNRLNLRRIEMEIFAENIANINLAKKIGFKLEGATKKPVKCLSTGKIHDCYIYAFSTENVSR